MCNLTGPRCLCQIFVQSHRSPMPLPNFRNGPRRPARCCGASVGATGSAPSARSRPWSVKKPPTTIQIGLDFSWVRWCLWCSPVCGVCGDVLFVVFGIIITAASTCAIFNKKNSAKNLANQINAKSQNNLKTQDHWNSKLSQKFQSLLQTQEESIASHVDFSLIFLAFIVPTCGHRVAK